MRSKMLDLEKYPCDPLKHKSLARFMFHYDQVFEALVHKNIQLLELGIYKGGSLLLWRDYFPKGTIAGIDIELPEDFEPGERIHLFKGNQTDIKFLSEVSNKIAPEGFDIIIDDASHIGEFTKRSFWHLFDNHLKPGGVYVIEDWKTGYIGNWLDGKGPKINCGKLNIDNPPDANTLNFRKGYIAKIRSNILIRHNFLMRFPRLWKYPFKSNRYGMVGFIKQLIDEQSQFSDMLITNYTVFVRKTNPSK